MLWFQFVLLMVLCKDLDQSHYTLFSISMLYLTYISNRIGPLKLTIRSSLLLLTFPFFIFGYITVVYNGFLALTPINYYFFIGFALLYLVVLAYAFLMNKIN